MVFPSLMVALAAYFMAPLPFIQQKLYKAVHTVAQKVMWDVVQILYNYKKDQGKVTTLKEISGFSEPKWKKVFGKHNSECSSIEKGNFDANCDITFLHQIIAEIFYQELLKLDNKCQNNIKWVKDLRNKVKKSVDESKLEFLLRGKLKDIYINVGKTFSKDFSGKIEEIEQQLDDIFLAKLVVDDKDKFDSDLKEHNDAKKSRMMTEGRKEFKDCYSKLKILNPCSSIDEEKFGHFTVDKIFTDLIIDDKVDKLAKIVINNILIAERLYSSKFVTPSVLVIQGLAGSGKTSLCRFFLNEWCVQGMDIAKLTDFDLVILVEVRTAKSKTLEEHLRQRILCNTMKQFPHDGIPLLKEMRILFVVDGFDDDVTTAVLIIKDILKEFKNIEEGGKLLNDSRIMITTRPEFKGDISKVLSEIGYGHLDLKVRGFDKTKVKKFAEKVFERYDERPKLIKFLDYLNGRGRILDKHLALPLTTALLIFLWLDDPEKVNRVTTSTQLFMEVFNLCKERLEAKIRTDSHKLKNRLSRKINDVFIFLGEIAWDMLQNNIINIPPETYAQLKEKCKPFNEETALKVMSSFLMCEPENDDTSYIVSFLHKTQMEYMAAEFLLSKILKENKSLEQIFENEEGNKTDCKGYLNVIMFLVGHLNIKNELKQRISSVFSIINEAKIEKDNYVFWWNLLSECCERNEINYDPFVGQEISKRLPKSWSLDSSNVTEALSLLNYTEVRPDNLVINISLNEDPNEISGFLEIINELSSKLESRYSSKSIQIELHLPYHFDAVDSNPSDLFLQALYPWAKITTFEGQIGNFTTHQETLQICKNFYVKVKTPTALRCVSESLRKIKTLRKVHISLEFSEMYEESEIVPIEFEKSCNFKISLNTKINMNINWIVQIVNKITNGKFCQELTLYNCVANTAELQEHLPKLKVSNKVTIDEPEDMEDAQKSTLERKVAFKIVWSA
ncbi:unnamed protein product, partial [Meganyctiphanes norvegica]